MFRVRPRAKHVPKHLPHRDFLHPHSSTKAHFACEEAEGQAGDGHNEGHPAITEASACLRPKFTSHPLHETHTLFSLAGGRCSCLWGVAICASFGMHLGTLHVDRGLTGSRRLCLPLGCREASGVLPALRKDLAPSWQRWAAHQIAIGTKWQVLR